MDYNEWGEEYLQEAQMLRQHLELLKRQMKKAGTAAAKDLGRRISLIYPMYLECLHTGKYLIRYGKRDEHAR